MTNELMQRALRELAGLLDREARDIRLRNFERIAALLRRKEALVGMCEEFLSKSAFGAATRPAGLAAGVTSFADSTSSTSAGFTLPPSTAARSAPRFCSGLAEACCTIAAATSGGVDANALAGAESLAAIETAASNGEP